MNSQSYEWLLTRVLAPIVKFDAIVYTMVHKHHPHSLLRNSFHSHSNKCLSHLALPTKCCSSPSKPSTSSPLSISQNSSTLTPTYSLRSSSSTQITQPPAHLIAMGSLSTPPLEPTPPRHQNSSTIFIFKSPIKTPLQTGLLTCI